MTPEQLFQISNQAALAGWVLLGIGLFVPRSWAERLLYLGGRLVPVALSLAYVAAIVVWWGSASGGFGSLDAVASLFSSKGLLLAGWVHYLAFDLWLGRWQVDQVLAAPSGALFSLLTLPCLFATLMFGPGGLLLFLLLSSTRRRLLRTRGVSP